MKLRFLFSLMLGAAITAAAQGGYQDGVDNYNAGRLDVAKTVLNNTINDASTDKAVSHFYLGNIALADNDMAAARKNYQEGIAANPHYGYNYIGLGSLDLRAGNKAEAEKMFKQGMNTDKKNSALTVAVARAYYEANPTMYAKDVDKYLSKALKDSKNSEAAIYVLQGDMKAKADPGEAAGLYEMAINQDAEKDVVNREAYVKYANTYFHVNPSYAIDKLKELNEKEPNSALAQRELAEKYYDNNQFGSACIQYGKYMQNPNHFQNDEQRYAGLLYSAGEYQKSLDMANQVLAKDPNNFYMQRVILLDEAALKNWTAAEQAGRKLFNHPGANLIPNDYVLYGQALSEEGKSEEAVQVLEKAIELNPENADLLPKLSSVYEKAGQNDKAVEILRQYLDAGNGSTQDIRDMAKRYQSLARTMEKGTPERAAAAADALKYINMAIEKAPNVGILYADKATILLTGNDDKPNAAMAEAYNKMIDTFDANPDTKDRYKSYYTSAYYLLGIYYMDNDKDKSRQYFQKYLELNPTDEDVQKLVENL